MGRRASSSKKGMADSHQAEAKKQSTPESREKGRLRSKKYRAKKQATPESREKGRLRGIKHRAKQQADPKTRGLEALRSKKYRAKRKANPESHKLGLHFGRLRSKKSRAKRKVNPESRELGRQKKQRRANVNVVCGRSNVSNKNNGKFDEQQYRELVLRNSATCPNCNCKTGTNLRHCLVCRSLMCRTSCRRTTSFPQTTSCHSTKSVGKLMVLNENTVDVGGHSITSGLISLPSNFQQNNFHEKYLEIFDKGYQPIYIPPARLRGGARNKKKNSKRKKQMSITGSTVMAATGEFLFEHTEDSGVKTSPRARLNSKCKPGGRGAQNLMDENIRPLALALEALVYKHNPECRVDLNLAKKIIPDHLRLFGTCFTAFAMVGDTSDGYVHIHKDKDDVASIILSMGADDVKGGDTVYYEDEKGRTEIGRTKFQHGQFQTGAFHNVYHGGERWTGKRGMISFYLNKRMLTHAIKYRDTEWHKEAYIKYTI